jgi:O-antigen ligase
VQAWFRLYGTAAVAIELAVFVYSVLAGTEPLKALKSLPAWAKLALLVLIGVAFYTAICVAPDGLRAIQWSFFSLVHLLFGLAVAGLLRNDDSTGRLAIWKAVALGGVGYLLIMIVFVAVALPTGSLNWEFFGLGGTNIRQVGFYSVVGAGASLGLAAVGTKTAQRMLFATSATLMLALTFWSGTRGALLAIFAAFAVGTLLLPALRKVTAWLTFAGSMACGALLSLTAPLPSPLYGIVRLGASSSSSSADVSSGRWDLWTGAWTAILHRPLTGYGAGQFFLVVDGKAGAFNHPHNIILQVLFHWGLVGALCYFSLAALLGRRAIRAMKHPQTADAPAFLVAVGLLTMSLYEGSLFHSYPTMMIAFALACIIAPRRELA